MRRSDGLLSFSATEVGNFLACEYLAELELEVANGSLKRPAENELERRLLEKRGLEHERRVLEHYRARGLSVTSIEPAVGAEATRLAAEQTLAAMAAGAELIYQGTLVTQGWVGRPDFLLKVSGAGRFAHHYEPVDAKLARETKARAVLQLCAYADQLRELTGVFPQHLHVATGASAERPEPLLSADFAAYFRAVRARLLAFTAAPAGERAASYPEPVEHCTVCRFWKRCEERRRSDDHLSLVAGITRRQRERLSQVGVTRLEQLALLEPELRIDGVGDDALERVRAQAAIQLRGRRDGSTPYELLEPEAPNIGLALLPKPTPGDLFLDLEGDPFVLDGGLEYLFGLVDFGEPEFDFIPRDAPGPLRYHGFWAENREQERAAFERVVDRIQRGREEFRGLHVYHFGHREADALKKLSCKHATRETEIDQLLRDGVLVDLLPIVRHALRAAVESYSLKELERLYAFERRTPLRDAARAMQLVGWWLETGESLDGVVDFRATVERYNEEDCRSTAALRDFLERLRTELERRRGAALARPARPESAPPERLSERQRISADLARRLTRDDLHPEAKERRLLADLLDFHWREAKSGWWEHYRALELAPADRLEDRSCIAELSLVGEERGASSSVYTYAFPEQEHAVRGRPDPCDPETGKPAGKVVELGPNYIKLKRGARSSASHPQALIVGRPIDAAPLPDALLALGEAVLGEVAGFEAARSLLFRRPPPQADGRALVREGEPPEAALDRLASELEGSVIAVQGPPGSGKTYQAARLILGLLRRGKRVGVTANSHAVIRQLLSRTVTLGAQAGTPELVRAVHVDAEGEVEPESAFRIETKKERARADLQAARCNLVGGTAWTWAREDFAASVDALVIDEAGQLSLANALAVARAGRGLVLFGDPAQLEQPQKGAHPPGAEVSALEHWLGGDALTIPPERGVFLPQTRRLHPLLCDFISSTFYEGRLRVDPSLHLERQELRGAGFGRGAGVHFVGVPHRGNTNQASEEVDVVEQLVRHLLSGGVEFQPADGAARPLTERDVLVVAAYNAQVAALRRVLPAGVAVGTVDKFQGKEAPLVMYSMASSSAEDAPRGMEFLYNLNRLNVAVSRAQALCIVVACPELTRAACKTPLQMKLVNALCSYLEHTGRGPSTAALGTQGLDGAG